MSRARLQLFLRPLTMKFCKTNAMKKLSYFLVLALFIFSCDEKTECGCDGDVIHTISASEEREGVLMLTTQGDDFSPFGHYRINTKDPGCNCTVSYKVCNEEILEQFGEIQQPTRVVFSAAVRATCEPDAHLGLKVSGELSIENIRGITD